MPLYVYKCKECPFMIEKFQKSIKEDDDTILCKDCGKECVKVFGSCEKDIRLNASDTYDQKIKPEVDRIASKIYSGNDSDFLDVCGEK